MESRNNPSETLNEIRSLMERSSRFISLSGLSGVAAGLFAILGAILAYLYLDMRPFDGRRLYYVEAVNSTKWGMSYITFFFLDALMVLIGAVAGGIFFTTRKAKKKGQKIWDSLSQRLLINLLIPLITGGIFCLGLFYHGFFGFLAPTTLVFYGLALINASKYTLDDVRSLGYCEIVLGLLALFYPGYGLEVWTIGFGFLHIIYGSLMYWKYER
ncbi:MAG: hypothetical protein AAF960_00840 [Bacteroidota bacterium]